jgi:hypothetical protein
MKTLQSIIALAALVALAACGGSTSKTAPSGTPLDPQGNWQFTFVGQNASTVFAGQLYELAPPVVTSNGLWGQDINCAGGGSLFANGEASGTNEIALTVKQVIPGYPELPFATYSVTGTIAEDQQHMSGAWSTTFTNGCTVDASGTWTALLLAPASGNWAGTASDGSTVLLNLTENIDQTSQDMGAVSGSGVISNGCFAAGSIQYTGNHLGQSLTLSGADVQGNAVSVAGTEDVLGHTYDATISITSGACAGRKLTATLTK